MALALFGFLRLSLLDVLDILLISLIIFLLFRWLWGSSAWSIFVAILSLYLIRFAVTVLGMRLTATIMDMVLDVGVLALIVIFQPEIRRFLTRLGNGTRVNAHTNNLLNKLFRNVSRDRMDSNAVNEITEACRRMSESKTGALIVIPHATPLDDIIATGDRIDAAIHRRLIMNLFFKNSPLHDGAVIINSNHIVAARCTLPITEKTDIPPNFGMRHKAAIGITEETDADAIVVSEETGNISFARGGNVTHINNINELNLLLNSSLSDNMEGRERNGRNTD